MSDMPSPDGALIEAIGVFMRSPPKFAMTDKKGRFPMATLKMSEDGASMDIVPLTHALTAESFEMLKSLVAALSAWRDAKAGEA